MQSSKPDWHVTRTILTTQIRSKQGRAKSVIMQPDACSITSYASAVCQYSCSQMFQFQDSFCKEELGAKYDALARCLVHNLLHVSKRPIWYARALYHLMHQVWVKDGAKAKHDPWSHFLHVLFSQFSIVNCYCHHCCGCDLLNCCNSNGSSSCSKHDAGVEHSPSK